MKRSHWKRVAAFLVTLAVLCQSVQSTAFAAEISEQVASVAEGETTEAAAQAEVKPEETNPSAEENGSVSNETPAVTFENPAAGDETPADPKKEVSENAAGTGEVSGNDLERHAGDLDPSALTDGDFYEITDARGEVWLGIEEGAERAFLKKYCGSNKNVVIPTVLDDDYGVVLLDDFSFGDNSSKIEVVSVDDANGGTVGCSDQLLQGLFRGMKNLKEADLRGVEAYSNSGGDLTLDSMFEGCSNLVSVKLPELSDIVSLKNMFKDCSKLEKCEFGELNDNYDGQVLCDSMFEGCSALKDVKVPNLPNVPSANGMFKGCSSLEELDLSHFSFSSTESCREMFSGCSSLKAIYYFGEYVWDLGCSANAVGDKMFAGCVKLEGGAGTKFNSASADQTMAVLDKDSRNDSKPGYLTNVEDRTYVTEDGWRYKSLGDGMACITEYCGTDTDIVIPAAISDEDCTNNVILDPSLYRYIRPDYVNPGAQDQERARSIFSEDMKKKITSVRVEKTSENKVSVALGWKRVIWAF